MRVLIDSNILFSTLYSSGSTPHRAYVKAVNPPYSGLICEQSLDELSNSFIKKFPDRSDDLKIFIYDVSSVIDIIPIPEAEHPDELKLRDPDDALILRAAIAANADIILTGDHDFLKSSINTPRIMTSAQFLDMDYIKI